ncbi:unnamed protein product [Schistosoma turkestanicum]|nr:unnamed protein product [Schistosoma turkestanicum]
MSEVLKSLLHYLNSNGTCSMILPLTRDLENAHFELADALNKLLPEPIIKQMAKYKHLEPQLKELESSAYRVNRHKRNLNQSYSRSRSTVKKEKANINYRASSVNYDYLTNSLMDKMNSIENEGTMACCDALFVLVSTYKQFSDRIYSILNYLFEEVNKLHECASKELNISYAKSLQNMENATQATKWKASSIMTCQDHEGSTYRSSSIGRIMSSSNFDSNDHLTSEKIEHDDPLSVTGLNNELLKIMKHQKLSSGTIGSVHSSHCLNRKSSSSLTPPPPLPTTPPSPSLKTQAKTLMTNGLNGIQFNESLTNRDTNKTPCLPSSVSLTTTTKSNEILDCHDHELSNHTTNLNSVNVEMTKSIDTNNPDLKNNNYDDIDNIKKNINNSGNKEQFALTNNLLTNSTSSTNSICNYPYYSSQQSNQYKQYYPYDHLKALAVSSIYSMNNTIPSSHSFTEKTDVVLPTTEPSNLYNMDCATKKSASSMLYLNKNNVSSLNDCCCDSDTEEISCIPIIVQKNSWSNTSPINNNSNNHKNKDDDNDMNSNRQIDSEPINRNDKRSNLLRESLLHDDEVRSSKQNIMSWGFLPSPITEEEDE